MLLLLFRKNKRVTLLEALFSTFLGENEGPMAIQPITFGVSETFNLISHLNLIGLFLMERGKRDLKN